MSILFKSHNLVLCYRAALDHAYETLKATDGSGVNFQDFLLFMEEFKPEICKMNHY